MEDIPYTCHSLDAADYQAISEVVKSNWITRGPSVQALEKKIQEYCKAPFVVLFNTGTLALEAAAFAADIQAADKIYSSANTFVGTLAGALKRSSCLHFLDICPETKSPDFFELPQLPLKSRAILIPVHFAGMAKKIEKLRRSDVMIEDACQAFGACYPSGERVGSCPTSDLTVFSFHPAKTICMGEGGAVTTRDEKLYQRLLLYRNNGMVKNKEDPLWIYRVEELTTNANVTEFAAALGLSQMRKIDTFLKARRSLVDIYRQELAHVEIIKLPPKCYDPISSHNLFTVEIDFDCLGLSRAEVMNKLRSMGIMTQVHFIPLYHHPYFEKHFHFHASSFPYTENYYKRALSLPLYAHLRKDQVQRVCQGLKEVLSASLAI